MKPILIYTAVILHLALVPTVDAQTFAASSLGNKCLAFTTSSYNQSQYQALFGPSQTEVFAPNGLGYIIDSNGNVTNGPFTYTYTANSATQGTIVENVTSAGVTIPVTFYLTFQGAGSGTFSSVILPQAIPVMDGNFSTTPYASPAPLVNISARGNLSPGQYQIAGFVVSGTVSRTVLIRAIGPTLSQYGVSNPIAHTTMSVMSGSTVIGSNTGWSSTDSATAALLTQTFNAVGAFSLPVGSADSAILLNLAPGTYTAVCQGISPSDSGTVLVEVYFVE